MEMPNVNSGSLLRANFLGTSQNKSVMPEISNQGNSTVRFNVNTKT